ncbi:hypothetical protein TcWFU_009930 [Taenia crassiceps]|uniref:Uncharacterized protein n=1 Tax=Taenia crassiceps TaxID=6207 RepID=A0ABR4Q0X9_9CEST
MRLNHIGAPCHTFSSSTLIQGSQNCKSPCRAYQLCKQSPILSPSRWSEREGVNRGVTRAHRLRRWMAMLETDSHRTRVCAFVVTPASANQKGASE